MVRILQTIYLIFLYIERDCFILIHTSLKFVTRGPISKRPALVQVMTWHHIGSNNYLYQWWPRLPMLLVVHVVSVLMFLRNLHYKKTVDQASVHVSKYRYIVEYFSNIDWLVQERRNTNALELHLSCTNPSTWELFIQNTHKKQSIDHLFWWGMESQIVKTHGFTLIRHQSITFASNRCLVDVDPKVFAVWDVLYEFPYPEPVFQWQSSGNPVCLELRSQCTLECHWRNASVLPVVFQCVPIMQINTGSPLGHHWVLASASVVPVYLWLQWSSSVFQLCKLTLDHQWSVQWYPSVLTESGLEVIRSGHFPACHP